MIVQFTNIDSVNIELEKVKDDIFIEFNLVDNIDIQLFDCNSNNELINVELNEQESINVEINSIQDPINIDFAQEKPIEVTFSNESGKDGKSAYQTWLDEGNVGTEQDFLYSLIGEDGYTPVKGVDYFDGDDGLSAYEIWLLDGNEGTEQDFLDSLKGADGTYVEPIQVDILYIDEQIQTVTSTYATLSTKLSTPQYTGEMIDYIDTVQDGITTRKTFTYSDENIIKVEKSIV